MGTPCVARRKGPPRHGGPTRAVGRRQSDGCSPAPGAVVQGQSSGPPRDGIPSSCGCWVCEFVFVLWFVVRDSYLIARLLCFAISDVNMLLLGLPPSFG